MTLESAEVSIRPLTVSDLPAALQLSTGAGWNQREEDWRLMLAIAPAGALAAIVADAIVGTGIGLDYGGFGWIAMMLVAPTQRRRGIGASLLHAAMATLRSDRPVRLDATPDGRLLYEQHEFVDELMITRCLARPGIAAAGERSDLDIRPMCISDLDDVSRIDARVFGGNRADVLRWALEQAPERALIARGDRGVSGYVFGRLGRLFNQIGPVAASDETVARELVAAACGRPTHERPVVIDSVDGRPGWDQWLREQGFLPQRPFHRMIRPPSGAAAPIVTGNDTGLTEYAIFGPEFA